MVAKTLEDVKVMLEQAVAKTLSDNVYVKAVEIIQNNIEEDVYSQYSPVKYKRREYSGGLIANENLPGEMGGTKLTIKATAPPNAAYGKSAGKDLPATVEYGITENYDFYNPAKGHGFAAARPFMQDAVTEMKGGDDIKKAIIDGLKSQGFNAHS